MNKIHFFMGCFAFAIFAQSSCASLREFLGFGFTQPKVTLRDISIQSLAHDHVKLLLKLKVKNVNNFDIKTEKMTYNVMIAGTPIAEGQYDKPAAIRAETSETVSLPLRIATGSALKMIKSLIEDPEKPVIAVINATIWFDSPVGIIEHTFSDEKTFTGKDTIPGN